MNKRDKPATPSVLMYVYPGFKKSIQKKAIDRGISAIDFTKELCEQSDIIEEEFIKGIKKINKNFGKIL